MPKSDDYVREGFKLAGVNFMIFLITGIASAGLFLLVYLVRTMGFPLPLPVWLIIIVVGIASSTFWYSYGKAFGKLIKKGSGQFIKGLTLVLLGGIPSYIILYFALSKAYLIKSIEIYKIFFNIYLMLIILMPLMILLGMYDRKE